MLLGGAEEHGADALAHPELRDHQPGEPGRLLEVVGRAGAHLVVDQPLGGPTAHDRVQLRQDLAPVVVEAVLLGEVLGHAQAHGRGG